MIELESDRRQGMTPPRLPIFTRVMLVVMYLSPLGSVAGWILAQGFVDQIVDAENGVIAYVHTLVTSSFAVVLFISSIVNVVITQVRRRNQPDSFARPLRWPFWEVIFLVGQASWLVGIATCRGLPGPIEGLAAAISMVASVVVFIYAVWRDAGSAARARAWSAARQANPARRRGRTMITVAAAAVVVALIAWGAVSLGMAELIETSHVNCSIHSLNDDREGHIQIDSSCGNFSLAGVTKKFDSINPDRRYDIVTRGLAGGIPVRAIVLQLRPH